MIVIVDGPRGVGKTTLCDQIEKAYARLGIEVDRFKDTRGEDPFEQMQDAIDRFKQRPHTIHICDRFLLTELVFSVYRRRTDIEELARRGRVIAEQLRPPDFLHYLLLADPRLLEYRIRDRPEDRQIDMPYELIDPLWRMSMLIGLPHIELRYNNTPFHTQGIVQEVLLSERSQNLIALREGRWI